VNHPYSDATATMPPSRELFIEQAMAEFESALIGYAATLLNDSDRARDVVQDTFMRLCQQDVATVRDHLKPWLFTVCRNRALDILRKEKRNQPLEHSHLQTAADPGLQPDAQAELAERLAHAMTQLNRLSANQRDVILLKFQQGLSYQEINHITGLSTGNIGFLIHTGLKHLRALMNE
jgi:RNA polymerase sigma-70 factor (ECF subfamily)